MIRTHLRSDQSSMWSDTSDRTNRCRSQATPQAAPAQAAASGLRPSRFLDRALQALRQSQLPVRQRARTRAQVLPVGELSGHLTANGLRASGRVRASQRELGQLRPDSTDLGGGVRDQPRTAASARAALKGNGEPGIPDAHQAHRSARRRHGIGQHAGRSDRRQPGPLRGGQP